MKRYISSALIVTLTACSSPVLQSNIFTHSTLDMEKVDSECADTAANEKNMHVAAVNCRFDAYEVILGERGFQEYNDLDTLKTHFIYIAKQQDAHKLTDAKAIEFFEKYTQEFYANLQRHDNLKSQVYEAQKAQTLAVIGAVASGLGTGLQSMGNAYGNAAAYQQQSIVQQQYQMPPQIQQPVYQPSYNSQPEPSERQRWINDLSDRLSNQ